MNAITRDVDEENVVSKAYEAGCNAFLIPDEDGGGPGHWHLNQNYGEGILWSLPLTRRNQVTPCCVAICGIANQSDNHR
jgi:hypothetical protein